LFFLRILFIGIYIWSGIHKLNPYFNDLIVESFAIDFFRIHNLEIISTIKSIGYLIPLFEITCGLLLYFNSTRKIAALAICAMHLFILLYLSPLVMNGNYIIFPWSAFMMIAVFFLFYRNTDKIELSSVTWKKHKTLNSVLVFLLILPCLKFNGLWDNYTSFSLYSGDASNFYMLSKKSVTLLKEYEILNEQLQQGKIIDLGKWSSDALNVPIPPEKRIFNQLVKQLNNPQLKHRFLETKTPLWKRKILDTYSLKKEREEKTWIQELSPIIFKDSVTIIIIRKL
jgi:uncharacterized membrane protein YphA (DoxX/SURF4 family)